MIARRLRVGVDEEGILEAINIRIFWCSSRIGTRELEEYSTMEKYSYAP